MQQERERERQNKNLSQAKFRFRSFLRFFLLLSQLRALSQLCALTLCFAQSFHHSRYRFCKYEILFGSVWFRVTLNSNLNIIVINRQQKKHVNDKQTTLILTTENNKKVKTNTISKQKLDITQKPNIHVVVIQR